MATLTSLLNLSSTALLADQSALNATSNNVANENTTGYTREVVNFQEQDSITIGGASYGDGVTAGTGATSVRDRVLEQRVQQQTQVAGQSSTIETALTDVENVFGLTSTSTSAASTTLGSAINSFYNSFSTLEANPSDTSTRQSVLTAATALTNAFNSASTQLASVSSSLDSEVGSTVGQINSLTASIASLNQQISSISPNADAGSLEDQRQSAIAQLSVLVGLDQVTTENNGITLTTTSGAVLVSAGQSFALQTSEVGGVTHVLSGSDGTDLTSSIAGGSLGGTLEARDQEIPSVVNSLDDLAYSIGTQVNTQNEAGLDGNGNAGGAIFTVPTSASGAAASIAVATTDPSSIAAASVGEGTTGDSNAVALAALASGTGVSGQSPSGYYASLLSQIGNSVSSATSDNTVQQAALTQLTTQRDAVSAVSSDQEAANLTQYQRSYEAAAKVFSIVDQLMADALNLGVQAAVS
ncbi:flagellar hook-associated protein FlgK [Granulicella arctica]|uniref:Flagellar hook-associated protein 1 n=1 Tax=Granulicella arctica TaxID=940613 RepID=A0A7Y9PI47_9BACT|nr:flagellar hook-associated protein FlgK [Granulicella arctica]NYF80160.1 flagellar hook-associated protein 1 FlgK [Granulicella arctica]